MAAVWRTTERLGREVVLTEARLTHILGQHPELVGRLDEIRLTVETLGEVRRDGEYAPRENHYRRLGPARRMVKVVVHYRPVTDRSRHRERGPAR